MNLMMMMMMINEVNTMTTKLFAFVVKKMVKIQTDIHLLLLGFLLNVLSDKNDQRTYARNVIIFSCIPVLKSLLDETNHSLRYVVVMGHD